MWFVAAATRTAEPAYVATTVGAPVFDIAMICTSSVKEYGSAVAFDKRL
jgi:hypothetical protein